MRVVRAMQEPAATRSTRLLGLKSASGVGVSAACCQSRGGAGASAVTWAAAPCLGATHDGRRCTDCLSAPSAAGSWPLRVRGLSSRCLLSRAA
jgi:hypothetical protein